MRTFELELHNCQPFYAGHIGGTSQELTVGRINPAREMPHLQINKYYAPREGWWLPAMMSSVWTVRRSRASAQPCDTKQQAPLAPAMQIDSLSGTFRTPMPRVPVEGLVLYDAQKEPIKHLVGRIASTGSTNQHAPARTAYAVLGFEAAAGLYDTLVENGAPHCLAVAGQFRQGQEILNPLAAELEDWPAAS